jgi:hypothetical protein
MIRQSGVLFIRCFFGGLVEGHHWRMSILWHPVSDYSSFPDARSLAYGLGNEFISNKIQGGESSERGSVVSVES